MEDEVDRHGRQEAEERRTHRRQRDQQPGKGRIQQQPAGAGHRSRAAGDRGTHQLECEDPQGQMSEEGRIVLAADDRDQDVVDSRQQQGVENQPGLPEERRRVGAPHGGPAHLGREGPPPPHLPEVRNQRRQAGAVRSIVVVNGLKFRMSRTAGRGHGDIAFSMPMASDLSYLHLSRLLCPTHVRAPVFSAFAHPTLTPRDGDHG